jgi:hypothetical protein
MRRLALTAAAVCCCLAFAPAAFAQASKSTAAAPKTTAAKKDAAPAVAPTPAPVSEEVMKARMRPPVKGTASVDYIAGPTKPVKDELVTVFKVKNTSSAPIVGFRIDQYFYKVKEEVSAGTGRLRNPMAPGEIVDVTITAPVKPGITGSQMRFSHANGSVQPTAVKKFGDAADPKKPAAAPPKKK